MTLWKVTKASTNALFLGLYRAGFCFAWLPAGSNLVQIQVAPTASLRGGTGAYAVYLGICG